MRYLTAGFRIFEFDRLFWYSLELLTVRLTAQTRVLVGIALVDSPSGLYI